MKIRRLALIATVVVVSGCGSRTSSPATRQTTAHAGRPYQLYTHCGIDWAKINGTFWRAQHPMSDGSGNPPAGWGNPLQDGTLVFINPATARFDSSAGSVTFERTSLKQPPFICS
ncbi:MAG: hypothetical protein JOZ95_11080 [Solirubrobacterales bacterium]|nr:hypothetical protein [Solirubrobacterales bacterium]